MLETGKEWSFFGLIEVVEFSTNSIRACKQMIENTCNVFSVEEKHKAERDAFIQVWGGLEHMEALQKNLKHN